MLKIMPASELGMHIAAMTLEAREIEKSRLEAEAKAQGDTLKQRARATLQQTQEKRRQRPKRIRRR